MVGKYYLNSTVDRVNNSDLLQQCIEVMTSWWCPSSYINSVSLHFSSGKPTSCWFLMQFSHNMIYYTPRQPKSNCFHDKSCPHLRLHTTVGTVILYPLKSRISQCGQKLSSVVSVLTAVSVLSPRHYCAMGEMLGRHPANPSENSDLPRSTAGLTEPLHCLSRVIGITG